MSVTADDIVWMVTTSEFLPAPEGTPVIRALLQVGEDEYGIQDSVYRIDLLTTPERALLRVMEQMERALLKAATATPLARPPRTPGPARTAATRERGVK